MGVPLIRFHAASLQQRGEVGGRRGGGDVVRGVVVGWWWGGGPDLGGRHGGEGGLEGQRCSRSQPTMVAQPTLAPACPPITVG